MLDILNLRVVNRTVQTRTRETMNDAFAPFFSDNAVDIIGKNFNGSSLGCGIWENAAVLIAADSLFNVGNSSFNGVTLNRNLFSKSKPKS